MESYTVKDLMVPLSEYATVPKGSTLFEAVMALEKAQEEFDCTKYRHRAVLILDENSQVVGKLSHLDVLHALAHQNEGAQKLEDLSRFGFGAKFIANLQQKQWPDGISLVQSCLDASQRKVEAFMQTPSEGEYVQEDTPLDIAIHQLVRGLHLSLLVTRGKGIVGILRMSDVFASVFHVMKEHENSQTEEG